MGGAEEGVLLFGRGKGADVALLDLPADVGGAPGGLRGEGGVREVVGDAMVEEVGLGGGVLRGAGPGGGLFLGGGSAEEDSVARFRGGADDALVANPAGGRGGVLILREVGLVRVVCFVFDIGVGKDADPGTAALDDDDLMPGGDERDALSVGVRGDIDVGVVQDGGAGGAVVAGGFLLLAALAGGGEGEEQSGKDRAA